MHRSFVLAAAVALVAVSCSSDEGVPQVEYEQAVNNILLAQQELLTSREELADALARAENAEAALEATEDLENEIAVLRGEVAFRDDMAITIISELGFEHDPARSPIEQLGEIVLLAAGEGEAVEGNPDRDRIDAYFGVISLIGGMGSAGVPDAEMFADVRPALDRTLDMELTTEYDILVAATADGVEAYRDALARFLQQAATFGQSTNAGGRPPG